MSDLSKRSAKYFFIQGLKFFFYTFLVQLLLVVEWIVIGGEEGTSTLDFVLNMLLNLGGYFIVFINLIFALYSPNWYDSVALSMGARRKDIFWGEIIKQFTFVVCNTAVLMLIAVVFHRNESLGYLLKSSILSIAIGPLGLVLGHKIKKFGKLFIGIIAVACGCFGGYFALSTMDVFTFNVPHISTLMFGIISLVLFLLFEVWVYKLNSKCMVK